MIESAQKLEDFNKQCEELVADMAFIKGKGESKDLLDEMKVLTNKLDEFLRSTNSASKLEMGIVAGAFAMMLYAMIDSLVAVVSKNMQEEYPMTNLALKNGRLHVDPEDNITLHDKNCDVFATSFGEAEAKLVAELPLN